MEVLFPAPFAPKSNESPLEQWLILGLGQGMSQRSQKIRKCLQHGTVKGHGDQPEAPAGQVEDDWSFNI